MVGASRMVGVLVVAIAAFVIVGCGGADGPDSSVNGCVIQAATVCPGADLSGADLEGAELSGADLSSTNLQDTNLSGANLTGTNLSSAQIVDTDLSDADLTRANLTNATISGANLDGATLCGTIRTDGTTDDTSCPASTDTTDTTDTTATAEVTSFALGVFDCAAGATEAPISVSWSTQSATAAELAVDGETATETGPSGTTEIQIPCDGEAHEVSVTALSDSGAGETESKEVSSS
jgi:Pentapeptide repeats (8 copies)